MRKLINYSLVSILLISLVGTLLYIHDQSFSESAVLFSKHDSIRKQNWVRVDHTDSFTDKRCVEACHDLKGFLCGSKVTSYSCCRSEEDCQTTLTGRDCTVPVKKFHCNLAWKDSGCKSKCADSKGYACGGAFGYSCCKNKDSCSWTNTCSNLVSNFDCEVY